LKEFYHAFLTSWNDCGSSPSWKCNTALIDVQGEARDQFGSERIERTSRKATKATIWMDEGGRIGRQKKEVEGRKGLPL
jgi:hypothetical protein